MKVYLAPMEGVVDHHMRYLLSRVGGIDICVTEFVRVTDHVLPRKVFTRFCPELLQQSNVSAMRLFTGGPGVADEAHRQKANALGALCPTRIQLLGSNASAIAGNAQKAARLGAPAVDLNFGCPAKTVNKNRGGACLLDEPETLYQIVKACRDAVPQATPVTAKIRLGYETRDRYLENAHAIYSAGASELVVHARSKADGYRPPAYWEKIDEIQKSVPMHVVANGEIWSLDDFHRCREMSGCTDVMIGRGLLAKPDLALEIKASVSQQNFTPLSWGEIAALLMEFFLLTSNAYPKKYMGNRVKQWLFYLQKQYSEAKTLFDAIKREREFTPLYMALASHCDKMYLEGEHHTHCEAAGITPQALVSE